MSCTPIMRLSKKKEPGFSRLAPIPPTRAARWTTRSGRRLGEQAPRRLALDEVVVLLARHDDLGAAPPQVGHHLAAEEAGAARHDDLLPLKSHVP